MTIYVHLLPPLWSEARGFYDWAGTMAPEDLPERRRREAADLRIAIEAYEEGIDSGSARYGLVPHVDEIVLWAVVHGNNGNTVLASRRSLSSAHDLEEPREFEVGDRGLIV